MVKNFLIVQQAMVLALSFALATPLQAQETDAAAAASLHARYVALQSRLGSTPFHKPLTLDSSEVSGTVAGDIYALVNSPFATAGAAFGAPADWCDILMLHLNTKGCLVSEPGAGTMISMWIGSKHDQPLAEASRVDFAYRVSARSAGYMRVELHAGTGPMGTRDYRVGLEAIPLDTGQTFIHLAFSNAYGNVGRIAMQGYLATVGRDKVGFTVIGTQPDGQPLYVGGMRGSVERNTMRYFLAIESFLGALSAPSPQARFEKRIRTWFEASELYARQLHEIEQGEYLAMKRKENARRLASPA